MSYLYFLTWSKKHRGKYISIFIFTKVNALLWVQEGFNAPSYEVIYYEISEPFIFTFINFKSEMQSFLFVLKNFLIKIHLITYEFFCPNYVLDSIGPKM
jgi:hypothetical protein